MYMLLLLHVNNFFCDLNFLYGYWSLRVKISRGFLLAGLFEISRVFYNGEKRVKLKSREIMYQ